MNQNKVEKIKPKLGIEQLENVLSYLKSLNLNVAVEDLKEAKEYLNDICSDLILVRDGMDGIRADYDKDEDKLVIWFTNGFQNPTNEKRVEIEKWIKNNFF